MQSVISNIQALEIKQNALIVKIVWLLVKRREEGGRSPLFANGGVMDEIWVNHYSNFQRILLVGEGDFSFSACLARVFGSGANMVATSFDSEECLKKKHSGSGSHLEELKRLGYLVLHDVDVHDMNEHPTIGNMKFKRIIFNFPHAGHLAKPAERRSCLLKRHKKLVLAFFMSAKEMLAEGGEIHVTHRHDPPYNWWKLDKLAKKAGLVLADWVAFNKMDYPGYQNKRGGDVKGNKTFPLGSPYTFKFSVSDGLYDAFSALQIY